jgi:hypothetical protein
MFDALVLAGVMLGIFGLVCMGIYIFTHDDVKWYTGVIPLILALIFYFIIVDNTTQEDYLIDKNYSNVKTMKLPKRAYKFVFSDTMRVEVTEYDMPLGAFWDYKTYRIYIDSITYIDIYSIPKYDSTDIDAGTKLYKE